MVSMIAAKETVVRSVAARAETVPTMMMVMKLSLPGESHESSSSPGGLFGEPGVVCRVLGKLVVEGTVAELLPLSLSPSIRSCRVRSRRR